MSELAVKKRVKYLDLLKCLGMFIVVQGHIHTNYSWFSLPLHSYVIPLYFFLSGLTFRASKFNSFGAFVKHRLKSLMLPYAMFSVVTWCVWAVFNRVQGVEVDYWGPLLQTLLAQGSGDFLVHNVPLWFVPCLFLIEMMYYWIDRLPKKRYILLALILCAFIGVWMINGDYSYIFHLMPWSAEGAFVGVAFYGVANLMVKRISLAELEAKVLSLKGYAIFAIIILTIILVPVSYWNGKMSIGSDLLGKSPILFYFDAFVGIVTIVLFSILVCSIKTKSVLFNKLMDFHLWFGRNSFYIMATHVPVKGVLIVAIASMLNCRKYYVENDYFLFALVFTATCLISSLLSVLVVKMKKHDEKMVEKFFKIRKEKVIRAKL